MSKQWSGDSHAGSLDPEPKFLTTTLSSLKPCPSTLRAALEQTASAEESPFYHCVYLDQASTEKHLHDLFKNRQDATVVHTQAAVQKFGHVQDLQGAKAHGQEEGGGESSPNQSPRPPSIPGAAGGQSHGGGQGSAAGRGESHSSLNSW